MKNKKPFIIEIIIGITFIFVGLSTDIDKYYSIIFCSMGFGLMSSSIVQLMRIYYWQNPKRQKQYEEKKREAYINSVDERKQHLRAKAGHITYQIMTFVLLILSFVLTLLHIQAWVIGMVFVLFLFQYFIGIIVFRILEKQL